MELLIHAEWRVYPAAALMLGGLVLAWHGVRRCRAAWPGTSRAMRPLEWMRGVRLAVLGLAAAGIGAAWWWQLGWLLALSLAIGGEETLESSLAISALRRGRTFAYGPRPRSRAAHWDAGMPGAGAREHQRT